MELEGDFFSQGWFLMQFTCLLETLMNKHKGIKALTMLHAGLL